MNYIQAHIAVSAVFSSFKESIVLTLHSGTSVSRLNLLTPSPEAGPEIIDLNSSSDESDTDLQVEDQI